MKVKGKLEKDKPFLQRTYIQRVVVANGEKHFFHFVSKTMILSRTVSKLKQRYSDRKKVEKAKDAVVQANEN